jgi:DNA-binding NtrC family response regulator
VVYLELTTCALAMVRSRRERTVADISAVIAALKGAQTFEDAATTTLDTLLDVVGAALAASRFAARGRVLRGMVHLRPGEGYKRLVVVEREPRASRRSEADKRSLPSASAWRWVVERGAPVAIDVNAGEEMRAPGSVPPAASVSHETQTRLADREVTHLLAIPLRAPGGRIDGMISLEADCRLAIGQPFVFSACRAELQQITDVAEVFLCALPLRDASAPVPDEHLPVVGESMAGPIQMLSVFAEQDETLLLTGPTGAGKSRLARWCHARSPRADKVFETVDLSAVPEELQLAELAGWKKGAFTGAVKDTPGAIARAEGGTLFIDEIDKLSLKAQAGLLRVLEERRYRPLGDGSPERAADVRFIVGTNARLADRVRAGSFREDLFFRINVLPLRVPGLSERKDEIRLWAAYMLARRQGRTDTGGGGAELSPEAEALLEAQPWPGNLRQLDNIVRRAYTLALMDRAASAPAIEITASHVRRALAYEEGSERRSLVDAFHLAAAAFVEECARRRQAGLVIDLDVSEAFRGFILGTAAAREGSAEEAFRLVGKEVHVEQRNHLKLWRREMERVAAMCELLGEKDTAPFGGLEASAKGSGRPGGESERPGGKRGR